MNRAEKEGVMGTTEVIVGYRHTGRETGNTDYYYKKIDVHADGEVTQEDIFEAIDRMIKKNDAKGTPFLESHILDHIVGIWVVKGSVDGGAVDAWRNALHDELSRYRAAIALEDAWSEYEKLAENYTERYGAHPTE